MKILTLLLGVIAMCAMATDATAAGIPGDSQGNKFYSEFHAGATIVPDSQLSDPSFSSISATNVQTQFDTGFNIGAVFGFKMKNGFRIEGEYTYRRADVSDMTGCLSDTCGSASGIGVDVGGDVSAHAIMANGFYEPRFGKWLPSIGGGIGVGIIDATLKSPTLGLTTSASETVFAYQGGAGIGYEFFPNVIASVDYRYWATQDPNLGGTKAEVSTHNIDVGIRFQF